MGYALGSRARSLPQHPNPIELTITPAGITEDGSSCRKMLGSPSPAIIARLPEAIFPYGSVFPLQVMAFMLSLPTAQH
jgi:hypothetical protein